MNEQENKNIEERWEKLSANKRDGTCGENGFNHSKSYLERLEFVKDMINKYNYIGELEKGTPGFMD